MEKLTLARHAMATRFEFVLAGADPVRLRAAGEEALDEIERIEGLLSLYRASSEISQVNARASAEAVRVSPEVFELLVACQAFTQATNGAFDITIAPLVRCWGFMKGGGSRPGDSAIEAARQLTGMRHVQLDPDAVTVRFLQPGVMLDLGAVGKGYALDSAAAILRDSGVESALLHGGTSTIYGLGSDPDGQPWKVAIELPARQPGEQAELLSVAVLRDEALSVSAIWGKFFEIDGETYGHVIDPRTGWPSRDALLGAVQVDSATVSDAISTGVLLRSEEELKNLTERIPGLKFLQVSKKGRKANGFQWIKPL